MYSGLSHKGHSLERTPLYKGHKILVASAVNAYDSPSPGTAVPVFLVQLYQYSWYNVAVADLPPVWTGCLLLITAMYFMHKASPHQSPDFRRLAIRLRSLLAFNWTGIRHFWNLCKPRRFRWDTSTGTE